ncbi:caspase family protein [Nocardia sp. NPDC050713]|uniref:caspase family protein n=1 Tax=Nocardia sp. NPDC050713 TaxID=3154511 RepID=UPI0033D9208E
MAKRSLIIANQHYRDPAYAELPGAAHDAAELEAVLANPDIGGFEVEVLRDATAAHCRIAIERFFGNARADDRLLLHMSCHGQKDLQNRLYLIGADSEKAYFASTGIDSAFINDQIEGSSSHQTVLLLDCCYSGAFARGWLTRSGSNSVDVTEPFSGRGRVVITASTSLQFSHESEASSRAAAEPSVFTSAVVQGLRSGAADLDGDGWISIDDLYNYVHDSVKRRTPHQTPTRSVNNVQGPLYIARNIAYRAKQASEDSRQSRHETPSVVTRTEQSWRRRWSAMSAATLLVLGVGAMATYLLGPDPAPAPASVERTLEIAKPGDTAELTFQGRTGRKVFVAATSSTLPSQCGLLVVRDPAGHQIASGCTYYDGTGYVDGTVLRADGEYTVTLDAANNATGKVTVRVSDVVDQDSAITADGAAVTSTLEAPGGVSKFRFTGNAGQRVFVGVTSSTLPLECGILELRDPANREIASGCTNADGTGYIDTERLTSSGEYTIVVDPSDSGTGESHVRLFDVIDQDTTISAAGPPATSSLEEPGAESKFRFAATAGQKVSVVVSSSTLPPQCGVIELRDRAGRELESECIDQSGAGFIENAILPAAGEYMIVIDPADDGTGESQVRLFNVNDQDTTITPDGPPVTAAIKEAGAVSELRFAGAVGQKVSIAVSSPTLPAQCGIIVLRDPTGKDVVDNGCINDDGTGNIATTLPATGEYTVVVDPAGPATGDSQVRLYTE